LIDYSFEKFLGISLSWSGEGVNTVGKDGNKVLVDCSPKFYRPTEVDLLLGDSTKAKEKLGWQTKVSFHQLIDEMFLYQSEGKLT
jgi:GDPmannose 4,6-dehydratase